MTQYHKMLHNPKTKGTINMFCKTVNINNRKEMIDFLLHHFRYYTMNPWNRSTSYANNVKLYNLDIPKEYEDKAYELLEISETFDAFNELFSEFTAMTGYTVGFNGRSNGYIVLYDTEYNHDTGILVTYPGRNIDQYEDFENWTLEALQERVRIVILFDKLCDDCRNAFINILENYDIVEDIAYEPVYVKQLTKKPDINK